MTEFLEVVKNRRSIRAFKDKPVEKEKIDQLLIGAKFRLKKLSDWEYVVNNRMSEEMQSEENHFLAYLYSLQGTMMILDRRHSIAATVIQLTAEALGLGSCWMQIRDRKYGDTGSSEDYVREVLGIPEKYRVECIIAVGYKKEEKQPYTDAEIEKLKARIHYNKF